MTTRLTTLLFISILLGACAGRPVPLAVEVPPVNDIQLSEVVRAPEQFRDADVRWGGTILSSRRRDNGLRVEVLQRFVGENGKPDPDGPSDGRFLADIKGEDKESYSRGRLITVAGTLGEPVKKQVNEQTEQTLPLVKARQHYTWRSPGDRNRDRYYPYHYRPPYFHFYGPYYRHPFHPYHYGPDVKRDNRH